MSRNSYPTETIIKCCTSYRAGPPVTSIVKESEVPRSTIYYWLKKHNNVSDAKEIKPQKELDNVRRTCEKAKQICEVLQLVNCTCHAPLKIKLYELEKLYGKFSTRVLCEALNVDRGTFYNHILRNKKTNTTYAKRRQELSDAIREVYEESKGLFGSAKILSVLQTRGYHTSTKMICALMEEMGLHSFRLHAKKEHAMWDKLREPKNILQREFAAEEPNLVWLSDCTQFTLFHKTYYICAIMDVFSRKIIAYKISSKASTQLVTATFKIAYDARNPDDRLVFHSDRGCQYTSYSFRKLLIANGITQSFSRSGNPYDNGAMESFFSSFKQEEVYRTSYRSVEDCKVHIAEYMEFYNSKRPHRANNYKTPDQTEELFYQRKMNRDVQTARFES
jgi:transposase InsO family protein